MVVRGVHTIAEESVLKSFGHMEWINEERMPKMLYMLEVEVARKKGETKDGMKNAFKV